MPKPTKEQKRKSAYIEMYKDYPDIVGADEICEMLNIGKKKVYEMVKSHKLEAIPCSRSIKVPKIVIIEYLLRNI